MFDWLDRLRERLNVGWWWHHWLPVLGYGAVLLALTLGLWRGGSEGLVSSLSVAFVPATFKAASASADLPSGRPARQSKVEDNFTSEQSGAAPPLTVCKALPPELRMQTKPLLVAPVSSLALAVPSRMPDTIVYSEKEDRKRLFIGLLLPTIMVAMDEVRQERRQLLGIISEMGLNPTELVFSEDKPAWRQRLGGDKTKFILGLTRKYRSVKADELLEMVNVLPPSLVIAQGALESSWGASRFATEVNNLFGMYANDESTLSAKDGSKTPRIMEYDSILESVRAYVLNINRLSAYQELRRIRSQTLDPLLIVEGLTQYSERKKLYIKDLKHIIASNKLQNYDTLILSAG